MFVRYEHVTHNTAGFRSQVHGQVHLAAWYVVCTAMHEILEQAVCVTTTGFHQAQMRLTSMSMHAMIGAEGLRLLGRAECLKRLSIAVWLVACGDPFCLTRPPMLLPATPGRLCMSST